MRREEEVFSIQHETEKRMPAEWERQEAAILTWPHEATDWKDMLGEITDTYSKLAMEIAKREKLIIVAPDRKPIIAAMERRIKKEEESNPDGIMGNIRIAEILSNDTWTRDHGPITLLDKSGKRIFLDFKFNGWGEKYEWNLDNSITKKLYYSGTISGSYEDHQDMVLEGGSIESDGKGTIITTSSCLLAPKRNQPMDKEEIDIQLRRRLGAKRIIWIKSGQIIGDDTDGHIDTLARMAPNDTILYMGTDDTDRLQYEGLREMEEQLREILTLDRHHYRLLRLPMPDPITYKGERLPATYANFLAINGAIIYPTYNQKTKDLEAGRIIGEAFPGREIIGVEALNIIRQRGSIHCCSMTIAKGD